MLLMPRTESTGALDCNGFPVAVGDLVAATEQLAADLKGREGVVAEVSHGNVLHVQMGEKVLIDSTNCEVLVAAGFLWKLVAHGGN